MSRRLLGIPALLLGLSACLPQPLKPPDDPPAEVARAVSERAAGPITFAYAADTLELAETPPAWVIRDAQTYAAFVARLPRYVLDESGEVGLNPDPLSRLPAPDFQRFMLVVVTRSDSAAVPPRIASVAEQAERLTVTFSHPPDGASERARPLGFGSYALLRLPYSDKPVVFEAARE